jgi:spore coat protein H
MWQRFGASWLTVAAVVLAPSGDALAGGGKPPKKEGADAVFQSTKVWPVHLTFSPKEYAAILPPERGLLQMLFGKAKSKKEQEPARPVHRNTFGVDLPWVTGTIEIGGETFRDVGIRYKGNGTFSDAARTIAKSFKIDLDYFGGTGVFHGAKTINLHCGVADPSRCRETLGYGIYRAAGAPAPRTALAEVWLTVPGKYAKEPLGVYTLIEHVDKRFLKAHFGSDKGLLMKPEGVDNINYLGEDWKAYKQRYNPKREATPAEVKRLIAFAKLVSQADDKEFRGQIASFVDIDAYLRFLAATAYICNSDSFFALGHNYYLYLHPKTGQFHFMPWDVDRAFANLPIFGTHEQAMNLSFRKPYFGSHKLNERLLAMPEVDARYKKLLAELAATAFAKDRVLKDLAAIEAATKEPMARGAKAATARRDRVTLPFEPPPGMKTFVEKRSESLARQLAGTSTGHVPGNLLMLLLPQKKDAGESKTNETSPP